MKKGLVFIVLCSLLLVFPALAAKPLGNAAAPSSNQSSGIFKDVPANHWAADSVYELVKMGVTKGYPDGTYRGERNITRYETAVFMANLANSLKKDLVNAEIHEVALTALVKKELDKRIEGKGAAVSGTVFFDYSKGVQNVTAANNFNLSRAYVNLTNTFSDNVKAKLTLDAARLNAHTQYYDFVKFAYADILNLLPQNLLNIPWTINARIGQQPTYWIGFADEILGLRYVTKSLVDRNRLAPSADLGVAAFGTVNTGILSQLNYLVQIVNGPGYLAAEDNAQKDVSGRVDLEVYPGLILAGGFRLKDLGTSGNGGKLANVLVACKTLPGTISFEYLYGEGQSGLSLGGTYTVLPAISVFARYDNYVPERSASGQDENTVIAGAAYDIRSNLKVAADYQGTSYGSSSTQTNAGKTVGTAYLHSQITF